MQTTIPRASVNVLALMLLGLAGAFAVDRIAGFGMTLPQAAVGVAFVLSVWFVTAPFHGNDQAARD